MSETPENQAEQFIQAEIDRAPEHLRRLGEFLADVLHEDQWPTANRMLLGAIEQANLWHHGEEFAVPRGVDVAAKIPKIYANVIAELRKGVAVKDLEDGSNGWEYDAAKTNKLMQTAAIFLEHLVAPIPQRIDR